MRNTLTRIPGRPERGLYLAVITVLTISLLLVMGTSYRQHAKIHRLRQERAAAADDLLLLRTQNETQRQVFQKDRIYIGWLQKQMSRFVEGEPEVWRAYAEEEQRYKAVVAHCTAIEYMFPRPLCLLPGARTSGRDQEWQRHHEDVFGVESGAEGHGPRGRE
jgi:hypothetical protein